MKQALLDILRCPATGDPLQVENGRTADGEIESGELVNARRSHRYEIIDFVPRFVGHENYAGSFGLQWNRFRRTQLDSWSGAPISRDRFYRFTGWSPDDLRGRRILDVGCGAGRFVEIALAAGAEVVAVDYSTAVDACWENHRFHPRVHVLQADIYDLPLKKGSFDFVYCFGVLQHTPDVRGAFHALPPNLRPGGRLAIDVYPKLRLSPLLPRYWLRPLTTRVPAERLFDVVQRLAPMLLPMSDAVGRVPVVGRKLRHAVPVANYRGILDLTREQIREWAILDTFDWLAPRYDQPQTAEALNGWFTEAGLRDVWVGRIGFLVGRARRPTVDEWPGGNMRYTPVAGGDAR